MQRVAQPGSRKFPPEDGAGFPAGPEVYTVPRKSLKCGIPLTDTCSLSVSHSVWQLSRHMLKRAGPTLPNVVCNKISKQLAAVSS